MSAEPSAQPTGPHTSSSAIEVKRMAPPGSPTSRTPSATTGANSNVYSSCSSAVKSFAYGGDTVTSDAATHAPSTRTSIRGPAANHPPSESCGPGA